MFSTKSIKPFTEVGPYWFCDVSPEPNVWGIELASDPGKVHAWYDSQNRTITPIDETAVSFVDKEEEIALAFEQFKSRPEYQVSTLSKLSEASVPPEDLYAELLTGVALIRAHRNGAENPDDILPKFNKCLDWLACTDFYVAPASTRYHESFRGGLCHHTLQVVSNILGMRSVPKFKSVKIEDAVLVALVHDWCKIGLYESYMRNVKNEDTGVWEKVESYRHKDSAIPLGHGVTSMFLARKFFQLSTDEALAIRWHMGHWRVCESEINELQHANEIAPLVHMVQFADQLSITSY